MNGNICRNAQSLYSVLNKNQSYKNSDNQIKNNPVSRTTTATTALPAFVCDDDGVGDDDEKYFETCSKHCLAIVWPFDKNGL